MRFCIRWQPIRPCPFTTCSRYVRAWNFSRKEAAAGLCFRAHRTTTNRCTRRLRRSWAPHTVLASRHPLRTMADTIGLKFTLQIRLFTHASRVPVMASVPWRNRRRLDGEPAVLLDMHGLPYILVKHEEIRIKPGPVLHHLPGKQRVRSRRNAVHFELALLACEHGS